jgi:hypothetical protein
MTWVSEKYSKSLDWLMESPPAGLRYLVMRNLLKYPEESEELADACNTAYKHGPIGEILSEMNELGYWVKPGAGYHPQYRSTAWAISLLAQLGASTAYDERVSKACEYMLDHSLTSDGRISMTSPGAPSGNIDCLQGMMLSALLDLNCNDPRLEAAFEWAARSVTGIGVAAFDQRQGQPRYYVSANSGSDFNCYMNKNLPCAWGAVSLMLAFSKLPEGRRAPLIQQAIREGVDFLFSVDPAVADYPMGFNQTPSRNWWKFGFPVFYIIDLLHNVETLVRLGFGADPRLSNALSLIRSKGDPHGRWNLDYSYAGKTWIDFGEKKLPNKWVTYRVLRVLDKIPA